MKSNIGVFGKMFRFYLALILFAGSLIFKSDWMFIISLGVLYESLSGWCAVNQILGKNSCPLKGHDAPQVSVFGTYTMGLAIVIFAIFLNIAASYLGIMTWYDFLSPAVDQKLMITDILFLFVIYPLSLGALIRQIKR